MSLPNSHLLTRLRTTAINDAYEDFILSRRAMRATTATLQHYRYSAGKFVEWLQQRGVTEPARIIPAHVRAWLVENADRLRGTSLHASARSVRTLLRFLHAEGYMPALINFNMPRLEKKRLPCLDAEGVRWVLAACTSPSERAFVLTMFDSGLRREECSLINWGDTLRPSGPSAMF